MSMGTILTIINIVTGIGSFLGAAAFAIVWWYFGSKEGREYQIELDDLFDRVDDQRDLPDPLAASAECVTKGNDALTLVASDFTCAFRSVPQ